MHSYLTQQRAHRIIVDTIRAGLAINNTTAIIAAAKDGGFPVLGGAKLYYKEYGWVLCGYAMDGRDVTSLVPSAELRELPLSEACKAVNKLRHAYDVYNRSLQIEWREEQRKRSRNQPPKRQRKPRPWVQFPGRDEYADRYSYLLDVEPLFEHEPVSWSFRRSRRFGGADGTQKLDDSGRVRKRAAHRATRRKLNSLARQMAKGYVPELEHIRLPKLNGCAGMNGLL